ncbi:MAG TPA: FAD-binding protein [Syntrophorhabdaceae bacterium]|nr:FAD-binding protein [Syntrophorhabdaceae bacterium]
MTKAIEELTDGVVETDFLIVGGGMVGMIAAIRARKNSRDLHITIVDKATMEYSGDGVGLDNFNQIPLHQEDVWAKDKGDDDVKKAVFGADRFKGLKQLKLEAKTMNNAYISQPILEEVGVNVREDDGSIQVIQGYRKGTVWGRVEYDDNGKPAEPWFGPMSRGSDLKMRLGTAVRKAGVSVFDRTMVTSLITKDGAAVGATAVDVRTGKFIVFKAKVVLLSTGGAARLYPYPWTTFPNNLFYTLMSPTLDGAGHIAALNAGAKLYSMEMNVVYNVSKGINHSSGGGACNWYFKMYNSKGEFLEDKYQDRVVTKAGGMIPGVNFLYSPNMKDNEYEKDVILSAKDKATPDEIAAVYFTAATEPTKALKFHKLAGGLTNEKPVECVTVLVGIGMASGGVLRENENSETGVKNLFAAGNVIGNAAGGSGGLTWGCLIADHVTELIPTQTQAKFGADQIRQIEEAKNWAFEPFQKQVRCAIHPLELENYVRNVNLNYVGIHRVKSKMEHAIELLRRARRTVPMLTAANPHELMRALEVQRVIDISELHVQSALIRNESRMIPIHYRDDYPDLDPAWDDIVVTAKKVGGEVKYNKEHLN